MMKFKEGVSPHPLFWWSILFILCCLNGVIVVALGKHCKDVIGVSRETGLDCSTITTHSLVNKTCNDLQDVLLRFSGDQVPLSLGECIEIVVQSGKYPITETITIHHNVVLHGTQNVTVTFSLNETLYPINALKPYYVLTFADSDYSEISGIDFHTSPGIITFQDITNVTVKNCSFRYFIQGAVDIFNCSVVLVTSCTFEHNGPVSVTKKQYRGHAGGLSLSYHKHKIFSMRPQFRVKKCTFRNNTSDPLASIQQSSTQILQQYIFTGRGGGCAIPMFSSSVPSNVTLEDCLFEANFARTLGGGLYVAFDGHLDHGVVLNRIKFVGNKCHSAGGLAVGFAFGSSQMDKVSSLFAYNSEFIENQAVLGGGAAVYPAQMGPDGRLSNFAHFENCTFTGNTAEILGAAMEFTSDLIHVFQNVESTKAFEVESCNFIGNDGGLGGAASAAYVPLNFSGINTFKANRGRSLLVLASRIEVHGTVEFIDNDGAGVGGGALYLVSMAHLKLFQGANLTFVGNTGVMGAAIVVDSRYVPSVYSRLQFNPLCFVQYENVTLFPEEWKNVSFTFSENKAVIASAVFMTNLDLCSWTQLENHHFDPEQVFQWEFVHFSNDSNNTAHEPDASNIEWNVQTPARKINITNNTVSAYPGEQFQLGVRAFDELGKPTATILRLSDKDDIAHYRFSPAVTTHTQIEDCSISTSFYTLAGKSDVEKVSVESIIGEVTSWDSFTVVSTSCPPGYVLSAAPLQGNMYTTCECDYQNPNILDCNGHSITLREGLWATLTTYSARNHLVTYSCPPQYCQCVLQSSGQIRTCKFIFNSENPNEQCSCDREGVLCGSCRNGYGVSVLLNKCVTCHDASGMLLITLIVADTVVFISLMLLTKTFPTWLYPCLFYIQVLSYVTEHFPPTFGNVHPYAYYMSSGLSFYFIYDFCLYHGMSAPVSYLLRYLPLSVALVTCSTVLVIRCIYKKPHNPWYGLWWIVVLMYTHVVHTSMSILNCPMLPGRSGDYKPHWYISGSVKCFQGGHAPLGILAILILAFCVTLIPLVLVYSVGWVQHPGWLRHTGEVMRKGFKKRYKWWATVELGRRMLLLLFIVPFSGNDYPALFVLSMLTAVFGFVQPYESMYCNILESLLSLDVLVLLLMRNTEQISEELQVLPQSNITANQCAYTSGVTGFTWLLLPFYYFPLIVLAIVSSVVVIHYVRQYFLNRHRSPILLEVQEEDIGRLHRAFTTSDLDIDDIKMYTAFEDTDDQSRSDTNPDDEAVEITLTYSNS